MKNQIANKIFQLSSQIHRGAKVSQRIKQIVYQLQNMVIKECSSRTGSTLSTPSPQNERKSQQMDIQIIPFDLSPIERYRQYNEIRIQEDDQFFCNEHIKENSGKINKEVIDSKQIKKQSLSVIREQPDEQLMQSRKKIQIQKQKQKKKRKRFNYLAMAQTYAYSR